MTDKVKVLKKKVVPKKKKLINKLKALGKKQKKLVLTVSPKERKLINKAVKKYKMNLLRGRKLEYQLKNLNSKVQLSFYKKYS